MFFPVRKVWESLRIGLAMHGYENASKHLPPAYTGTSSAEWSWGTFILPFIEQQPLYDTFAPTQRTLKAYLDAGGAVAPLQTAISTYRCPSDPLFKPVFDPATMTNLPASEEQRPPLWQDHRRAEQNHHGRGAIDQ